VTERLSRSDDEVNEQLNLAAEGMDKGTRWAGMSYEQGVDAALHWVLGHSDDKPMAD
jgi:hypothetical protein